MSLLTNQSVYPEKLVKTTTMHSQRFIVRGVTPLY